MTHRFTQSVVTDAALAWLARLGYVMLHATAITPGEPVGERADYRQVIMEDATPGFDGLALRGVFRPARGAQS